MAAPAPTSQREMRNRNLSRVLYAVAGEPSSRAAVASRIGLTRAAVSTLVDELLHAGLLVELGPGRTASGVGRPGTTLALAGDGPCGIGAEIGVDHLTVCGVDLAGRVRSRIREESANRNSDAGSVLTRLGALVEQVCTEATETGLRPAGLTVAVPGLVERGSATVVRAPNLGWRGTDVATGLPRITGLPDPLPLTVDNEANLGALAELWLGGRGSDGRMLRDFVHVSGQAGIGAALVLDGELLRGTRGFAGELGHVPVRPEGPRCACGGRGCLEQYAGEAAVLHAAGTDPRERPEAAASFTGVTERAGAGDRQALRALRGAGKALGIALSGTVNLLDPQAVLLGGAFVRLGPWVLPALEKELRQRTAARGPAPELAVSALGPDGPLLGAAHAVIRTVLDDPLSHPVVRRA